MGHSLLLMHSGLQYGGEPINSGRQLHEGEFPDIWHWVLGPHGDGWQTFIGSSGACAIIISKMKSWGYLSVYGIWKIQSNIGTFSFQKDKEIFKELI